VSGGQKKPKKEKGIKNPKDFFPHFHDCSFEREDNFRFKFESCRFRVASILRADRLSPEMK
jgi:hypothetical protein